MLCWCTKLIYPKGQKLEDVGARYPMGDLKRFAIHFYVLYSREPKNPEE